MMANEPSFRCEHCYSILDFYRGELGRILGVKITPEHINKALQVYPPRQRSWGISSPRSKAQLQCYSLQCQAHREHHWKVNRPAPTKDVKEIGA